MTPIKRDGNYESSGLKVFAREERERNRRLAALRRCVVGESR